MERPFEVIVDKRTAIKISLHIIGMLLGKRITDKMKKNEALFIPGAISNWLYSVVEIDKKLKANSRKNRI